MRQIRDGMGKVTIGTNDGPGGPTLPTVVTLSVPTSGADELSAAEARELAAWLDEGPESATHVLNGDSPSAVARDLRRAAAWVSGDGPTCFELHLHSTEVHGELHPTMDSGRRFDTFDEVQRFLADLDYVPDDCGVTDRDEWEEIAHKYKFVQEGDEGHVKWFATVKEVPDYEAGEDRYAVGDEADA